MDRKLKIETIQKQFEYLLDSVQDDGLDLYDAIILDLEDLKSDILDEIEKKEERNKGIFGFIKKYDLQIFTIVSFFVGYISGAFFN